MEIEPDKTIKLSVLSTPCHLPVVRSATEKVCEMAGFDADVIGNIILSVDEALTNIIRHAYGGASGGPIEIELTPFAEPTGGGVRICLRDFGRCVDHSRIKSRDLSDVRPGGLGVHIMKKCMDRVDYQPLEGGGTVLTMVKNLPVKKETPKT